VIAVNCDYDLVGVVSLLHLHFCAIFEVLKNYFDFDLIGLFLIGKICDLPGSGAGQGKIYHVCLMYG